MEEPMNYNTTPTPGQAASSAPSPTPAPEAPGAETPGQEKAEPQYLTRAEATALEQRILHEAHSYADKGRRRVEKDLEEVTREVNQMTRPIETTEEAHKAQ